MPNKAEAEKAISSLNGKDLKGRPLTVNEARPRTDRPRTGGGGGRDGFSGGRRGGRRSLASPSPDYRVPVSTSWAKNRKLSRIF